MKKFKILLLLLLLSACSSNNAPAKEQAVPTKQLVDPNGEAFIVPEEINRIIVMAPSITEVLIDLGYAGKIVAADSRSAAYEDLPDGLPAFDMMTPDAEGMAALTPDIIFVSGMSTAQNDGLFKPLADLGIPVAIIPTSNSIEEIERDVLFIARVVNREKDGLKLCANMREAIAGAAKLGESITQPKRVYFEIAAPPGMYSFGSGVFLNELIELIGGENVFAEETGWISVEAESAIAANPDVILTNIDYIDDPVENILTRTGWQEVTAVKNKDVYFIDSVSSALPNHNITKALNEIAKAVYPDIYE